MRSLKICLSVLCLIALTACQTKRKAHTTQKQSLEEMSITHVLKEIRLAEKERDEWIARIGTPTTSLQEEAKRRKDSVYSDEKYAQDVEAFVDTLLRRAQAVHDESRAYRDWFFRCERTMLKTNTPIIAPNKP